MRVLDLKQSIEEAIAAPRVHQQWSPDQAVCEKALDSAIVDVLAARGHVIERISRAAVSQGISISAGNQLTAASDPRVPSAALSAS